MRYCKFVIKQKGKAMLKNTETLDKLYLEWSQFTKAKTARELWLIQMIKDIGNAKSWEAQAVMCEIALAKIEDREIEPWAVEANN